MLYRGSDGQEGPTTTGPSLTDRPGRISTVKVRVEEIVYRLCLSCMGLSLSGRSLGEPLVPRLVPMIERLLELRRWLVYEGMTGSLPPLRSLRLHSFDKVVYRRCFLCTYHSHPDFSLLWETRAARYFLSDPLISPEVSSMTIPSEMLPSGSGSPGMRRSRNPAGMEAFRQVSAVYGSSISMKPFP